MSSVSKQQVEAVIETYIDPYLEKDFISTKCVKNIQIQATQLSVHIVLGFPCQHYQATLTQALRAHLAPLGFAQIDIIVEQQIVAHAVQPTITPMRNVKNIIAVASGKGGVGKSTTAVNLALALAAEGGNVGILDADIYGPSQPRMLGATSRPETTDGKSFEPVVCHGLQSMSIGYLIDEEEPMVWRGPMVTQALTQLLNDTRWRALDYLVIDLPPGTGDIQLTLAQKIPVSGAIIVTTPQDIALLDARKGLKMFEKVNVPVLGVVENMSIHICSQCGHAEPIFGEGGGAKMAADYGVTLLGALPLDMSIRVNADGGHPSLVADPSGKIAQIYGDIARRVAAKLSLRNKDYSTKFPTITIQNN